MITTPIDTMKLPPKRQALHISRTQAGPPKRLTMLVYGSPGSGKTTFAATFPKPLFIDIQGGLMSIRAQEVAYVQPATYDDLIQCVIPDNVSAYETVILDTATHTVQFIMDHVLTVIGKHDLPTLAEWAATVEYTKRLIIALLALPQHILVTAEERTDKDEDTGRILGGPDLPGSLPQRLSALFDCVFHLHLGFNAATSTKGRWLGTQPEGIFFARDRIGGLAAKEPPDFDIIWKKATKA